MVFYASDFVRARETAAEALAALQTLAPQASPMDLPLAADDAHVGVGAEAGTGVMDGGGRARNAVGGGEDGVCLEPLLRERFFGELEGLPVAVYNDVWPLDLEVSQRNLEAS